MPLFSYGRRSDARSSPPPSGAGDANSSSSKRRIESGKKSSSRQTKEDQRLARRYFQIQDRYVVLQKLNAYQVLSFQPVAFPLSLSFSLLSSFISIIQISYRPSYPLCGRHTADYHQYIIRLCVRLDFCESVQLHKGWLATVFGLSKSGRAARYSDRKE